MVDLRAEQRGDPAGAATPNASGDGDELFERIDIATGLSVGSAIDEGMPANCASGQGHTIQQHPVTAAPYCSSCCPLQDGADPTKIASTGD